ncbi:MAG TPA: four helix bundle protein [Phycisphaerae bacterium]
MVQHYRQLIAWQKAVSMVTDAYRLTKDFPREEIYGLTSQIRRSAVSVPSNIAEGSGRRSTGEFLQFLGHSYGSLCELETQIIIAGNLGYLAQENLNTFLNQAAEVGRILNGLISSLTTSH